MSGKTSTNESGVASETTTESVMNGLKDFQARAVDHVIDRFYGAGAVDGDAPRSGRFLVADETGLGKSIIARGVIARAIDELEKVDDVKRIDIVYICSNIDLANQNLKRLNVTGSSEIAMTTRLTMLARESARLSAESGDGKKKVNLVSFTPGTSFSEGGRRQGNAQERAMLTLILDEIFNTTEEDRRATRVLLKGSVKSIERFENRYVNSLRNDLDGHLDGRIVTEFTHLLAEVAPGRANSLACEFTSIRADLEGVKRLSGALWTRGANLTAALRQVLAKASVSTLEPDLIILDEFQRFRHLMADRTSGDAAELAHELFGWKDAKVLLLSATPYKPFTDANDVDDDHYRDFLDTVRFLSGGEAGSEAGVKAALAAFRRTLVSGDLAAAKVAAEAASDALRPIMSRSERPQLGDGDDMLAVRALNGGVPKADDLLEWAALQKLAQTLGTPIDLEYWKSIPYFANFMDGYKPARVVDAQLEGDDPTAAASALAAVRGLSKDAIEAFAKIDLGNGYLRALAAETVEAGWWKLLWMPASMPYLTAGPHYSSFDGSSLTKRVIFSAWSGVPTAVAALLSYEADRQAAGDLSVLKANTPEARRAVSLRLAYPAGADSNTTGLSTLALFWPHPGLAAQGDPLAAAKSSDTGLVGAASLIESVNARYADLEPASQAWSAFFSAPGAVPAVLEGFGPQALLDSNRGDEDDDSDEPASTSGFVERVQQALQMIDSATPSQHPELGALAAHAPGNIAFRALKSVAGPTATEEGMWRAAWIISGGLRSLFNRRETTALLSTLYGDGESSSEPRYWQRVLDYCADGNLQAVLDEYLFQLASERGGGDLDDAGLADVADAAADVLSLRAVRYRAKDTSAERAPISFNSRFALRYGARTDADASEAAGVRQSEVRAAFNSPFAPFVLASTSVGQEGIDFHWWSHSVTHWNLPSNPVDFEQREGRVNRYMGHAIRKNVATANWDAVRSSAAPSPWAVAFDAAAQSAGDSAAGLGEFAPWWVYPGDAKIERVIASYVAEHGLSRDTARYERLRDDLALYRLTLGQPRQADMLALMEARGLSEVDLPAIDLRP